MVCKPDEFNGYKPKPRDWLESYEECFQANDWSEAIAIKYFPTFLRGTALEWFKTMARPKLDADSKWDDLKAMFTRHYLGRDELRRRQRELSEMLQGARESSISFIPRAYYSMKLLNPNISEAEAIDKITDKLRPEIINGLGLTEPLTIEELVRLTTQIEDKIRRVAERIKKSIAQESNKNNMATNQQKPRDENDATNSKNKPSNSYNDADKKTQIKCYRCDGFGHIGKDCTATETVNGGPIKLPKQKPIQLDAVVNAIQPRLNFNRLVSTIDKIHAIEVTENDDNRDVASVSGPPVSHSKSLPSKLLFQTISCNGVKVAGLIDTGSFHSVIDEQIVRENKWVIESPAPILGAAGNNPLRCVGTCEIEVELTINNRTRSAKLHFAIVTNLGTKLLIGLEFISIFRLIIDTESRQIYFKRSSIEKRSRGIRNIAKLSFEPRTQTMIEARAETTNTILTKPTKLKNGLFIANSVSKVENNTIHLVVLNPTNHQITISPNSYLASFELLPDGNENDVNRIVELDNFDESISVGEDLTDEQLKHLSSILEKNKTAFTQKGKIGCCKNIQFHHKIELLPGSKPFNESLRRRPKIHVDETRRQVNQMLEQGIIEPSESPWSSAYLLVKKKSGEYRLCIDFRKLNMLTKKLVYPLPNIEDCIDTLSGKKFFSLLDFSSGFLQLPLDEKSKELTAFKTEDGLFHYTRMPFGLANAPASFQKMVNVMFSGLRGVNLQIFIDDICIASDTFEEHMMMLNRVLAVVIKSNMTLKSSKCMFATKRILFLGHEISEAGVRQDPDKTRALLAMSPPTDIPGVRRILGMLGYYRKFIPNFASVSSPLTRLLKKGTKFVWLEAEQKAFDSLLRSLAEEITLSHFNHRDPLTLKTDASKTGVAAILLQKQDGVWRLIVCCSRRLNEHEANYGISELEGLAVVYAVSKLRSYLLGKRFNLWTDHSALTVWNSGDPKSARLKRWKLILSEFDYEIVYTKGQLQTDVDCLSRAPVDTADRYVENRVFAIATPVDSQDWWDNTDDEQSRHFRSLALDHEGGFNLRGGHVYLGNLLYVPPSKVTAIVNESHSSAVAGHGGIEATTERLKSYWWPNKSADIKKIVSACQICQFRKVERAKSAGTMKSFDIYKRNQLVAIDVIGPITETLNMNRHIIVAIDCFTRFAHAKAVPDTSSANYVKFLLEWAGIFGIPRRILTDNAKGFDCRFSKEIEQVLNVPHIFSTPKHSQGNAIVERAIQSLEDKLNLNLKQQGMNENQWDFILPIAVLSYNTSFHSSIGYSPYEMSWGEPHEINNKTIKTKEAGTSDIYVQLLNKQVEAMRVEAVSRQSDRQAAAKINYDKNRRNVEFNVGDLVLVKGRNRASKLADKFEKIARVENKNDDIYKLVDCETNSKFSRHVSKLKKYIPNINCITHCTTMKKGTLKEFILTTIFVAAIGQCVYSVIIRNGNFVAWRRVSMNVLSEKKEFEVKIRFTDPCPMLHQWFPTAPQTYSSDSNWVYWAHAHCHHDYWKYVLLPMRELKWRLEQQPIRQGRAIPFFGLVGGIWLSNVLDSVFNDNNEIAKHEAQQDELLRNLNKRQNWTTEAIIELSRNQNYLTDKVNELYKANGEEHRKAIRLNFALTKLHAQFAAKKAAIESLRFSLVNSKKLDLQSLNILLDTRMFEDIDSSSIEMLAIDKIDDEIYYIRFYGHFIDDSMQVYEIKTLPHWSNLTQSEAVLLTYTGPPKVLINTTNNCVLGIYDLQPDTVSQPCILRNSRSSDLDSWAITDKGNPFENVLPTRFIEDLPNVNIYCLGRKISINQEDSIDCPPYAFALPTSIKWNTNDRNWIGYAKSLYNFTVKLPDNLVPAEISEPNNTRFAAIDALKRIYNLTEQLQREQTKLYALNTPVGGVSYAVMTKILLLSVASLAIIVIYFWKHNHLTTKKRHGKLLSKISTQIENAIILPERQAINPNASSSSIYPTQEINIEVDKQKILRQSEMMEEKTKAIIALIDSRP